MNKVLVSVPGALVLVLSLASEPADIRAEDGFGAVTGQFVFDGEVPERGLAAKKGDANVKDAAVCAAKDVPADDLVVDPETKGIANVFIYLVRAPSKVHPDLKDTPQEPAVFDQKHCRFIPHALFVRAGQEVLVKSDDPVPHNTHTYPLRNQGVNFTIPPNHREGVPVTLRSGESIPFKVTCDIHPHMLAWWLVLDHPYAAISDEQGRFTIEGLPEGEHEFRVWHERVGWIDRAYAVRVEDGAVTQLGEILVPVERFAPRG